jgi:hypothetical protein
MASMVTLRGFDGGSPTVIGETTSDFSWSDAVNQPADPFFALPPAVTVSEHGLRLSSPAHSLKADEPLACHKPGIDD